MMRSFVLLALVCLVSGCWYTQVTDGTISTRGVSFDGAYQIDYSRKISASDRKHIIWYFPTGVPSPQEAVDKTLDSVSGHRTVVGLVHAKVKYRWFWLYLYGQTWFTAEGYPIYEVEKDVARKTAGQKNVKSMSKVIEESPAQSRPLSASEVRKDELTDLPF